MPAIRVKPDLARIALAAAILCAVPGAAWAGEPRSHQPRALHEIEPEEPRNLEEVEPAEPVPVEEAESRPDSWQPPPCDTLPPAERAEPLPRRGDVRGWESRLARARARIAGTRAALAEAEAAYSRDRTHRKQAGADRARLIAELEAARLAYARALCELPELVEKARRAGVPPRILLDYE